MERNVFEDFDYNFDYAGADPKLYADTNCYTSNGATNILQNGANGARYTDQTLEDCKSLCRATPSCNLITYGRADGPDAHRCYLRTAPSPFVQSHCKLGDGRFDGYLFASTG